MPRLSEVIVKYSGDLDVLASESGALAENLGDGYAILTLPAEQIPQLRFRRGVLYAELPKILTPSVRRSMMSACVRPVQNGYKLTGKGVLVGVIDSGIDYTHPDFRNEDGSSRIASIWDQTLNGKPPAGFLHGSEYSGSEINAALSSPNPLAFVPTADEVGHGTAVAGIAAGNGRAGGGREKGAAPDASLVIVKLGGYSSITGSADIMRAVKYIIDKAEDLGMPAAINISLGSNDGPHDGSSLFETYLDSAAQRWKTVIVAAAGNEGAAGHHYSGQISSGQTMDVTFAAAERLESLYLTLWMSFADELSIEMILPGGQSAGVIGPSRRTVEMSAEGVSIQAAYGEPTHYSEAQGVYFKASGGEIPLGIWRLRVRAGNIVTGRFDIWLPTTEEVGRGVAFTSPSPEATLTIPSTAARVISVGGYNDALNIAAPFSGRGFNGRHTKPDLSAPAVDIVTARPGGGYGVFSGTSMAAPFVTGASALMLQWGIVLGNDSFLYGQKVNAYLKRGAQRSPFLNYPNPIWGWGTLCLRDTMEALLSNAKTD